MNGWIFGGKMAVVNEMLKREQEKEMNMSWREERSLETRTPDQGCGRSTRNV